MTSCSVSQKIKMADLESAVASGRAQETVARKRVEVEADKKKRLLASMTFDADAIAKRQAAAVAADTRARERDAATLAKERSAQERIMDALRRKEGEVMMARKVRHLRGAEGSADAAEAAAKQSVGSAASAPSAVPPASASAAAESNEMWFLIRQSRFNHVLFVCCRYA